MARSHYIKNAVIFWTVLALCCVFSGKAGYALAADLTTVTFLRKAEVGTDTIQLGDIAEIQGENRALVQKLQGIVIGKSSLPGKSCEINKDYVIIRLKQNDVDISQIAFADTGNTEVLRSFTEISRERLEQIVLDFIYAHAPWDRSKLQVRNIRASENVILPKGQVTYAVAPGRHNDFMGTVILPILFTVDGNFKKKVLATADVALFGEVVMTKKPLGRYHVITEDDVHLQRVDMGKMPSTIITTCEEVLGKRAKRTINANTVLSTNLIELPPLVKRGNLVKIIAQSNALTISTIGEVKEKGGRGDRVKVENLESRKEISARVLNSHTVTVDF